MPEAVGMGRRLYCSGCFWTIRKTRYPPIS